MKRSEYKHVLPKGIRLKWESLENVGKIRFSADSIKGTRVTPVSLEESSSKKLMSEAKEKNFLIP